MLATSDRLSLAAASYNATHISGVTIKARCRNREMASRKQVERYGKPEAVLRKCRRKVAALGL